MYVYESNYILDKLQTFEAYIKPSKNLWGLHCPIDQAVWRSDAKKNCRLFEGQGLP